MIATPRIFQVAIERTTSEIPRRSYSEKLNDFEAACAWLVTFGVNINATRIGSYRRVFTEIEKNHREGTIDKLLIKHGFGLMANVLFESSELIDIHEGLGEVDQDFGHSLQKFTAGCTLLTDERRTGNNIARNVGFELDTAAWFQRSGFPITLTPPSDLWTQVGNTPIAVECKRPFSYEGLGGNLNKAFSQLRQRYRDHATPSQIRGIAALSASKMENDGSRMLRAVNGADLAASIRQVSNNFVAKTEEFWSDARDDRTIGLFVRLRAPSWIENINLFTVVQHFTWIDLTQTRSDQELLRRLVDAQWSSVHQKIPTVKTSALDSN
jgi:hypothetical protein